MNNKEIIEKAVITADDLAAGGKLNPEQSDKFLDYVIEETLLTGVVRTVKFQPEQAYIDKIGVGKRVAVPKAEATDPGVRRGVSTGRVTLTPKEVMVPFEVGDNFLQWNIEGEDVQETLIRMMAAQLANNLEEFYITGDVLGPAVIEADILEGGDVAKVVKDSFLALADGWLRLADQGHVVDAANNSISSTLFSNLMKALPTKFKKNKANLKFMSASETDQNYRQTVAIRVSETGDKALQSQLNLTPFGVELVPVPLFPYEIPVVEHLSLPGTTGVDLRYKPIVVDSEIVTAQTLGSTPVTPLADGVDYDMDYVNGKIARKAGADPLLVKVTYLAGAQVLLTHYRNLILAIGRDVRIEKDRDIFKGVNQYAITVKAFPGMEEVDAVAKLKNVKLD